MRIPTICVAGILLFLCSSPSLAQSPVDSVYNHLQRLKTENAAVYLNKVFAPEFSVTQPVIDQLEKRRSSLPEAITSMLYSYAGEHIVIEKKDIKRGYPYFKEAYRLAVKLDGYPLLIYYQKHSALFKSIPRYDSAIFYARKMFDLARKLKHDSLELAALSRSGYLNYDASQYPESAQHFKLILAKPWISKVEKRNAYNTIGLCFRKQKIYDSAYYYFHQSLTHTEVNDRFYQGLVYGNIGDTYYLQKRYKEALPFLLTELNYCKRDHITRVALDCMSTITDLYVEVNDLTSAKLYFDSLTHHINSPHATSAVKLNYLKVASKYFQKKGDYNKAMASLNRFYALKDSLAEVTNIQLVTEMNAQYDFDSQRREIELLHNQNLAQEARAKQQTFLLYGSLAILLLTSGLLFVLYKNQREKKKSFELMKQHTHYVEQVNEELKVNLEEIEEKNNEINKLALHLREVNATKDKLFSIVGHDLRNPIHSLKGLLALVTTAGISKEEFLQFSDKLKDGVEHIEFTLNNLLQWAKSQMQGLHTHRSKTDVNKLVGENVNFHYASALSKGIQLQNAVSENIFVLADRDQLNLVLRNLISNALKFTDSNGRILLDCKRGPDNTAVISIIDTGVGMNEEVVDKLFKKNIHYSTSGTQGEKGSGLGLLLCYEMIEKNQGKMWVESKEGKGTIFYISLPLA